jgi:hypothetical protein
MEQDNDGDSNHRARAHFSVFRKIHKKPSQHLTAGVARQTRAI